MGHGLMRRIGRRTQTQVTLLVEDVPDNDASAVSSSVDTQNRPLMDT